MVYRLLRALLRHALRVFYRRIEVEGLEDVPQRGPLLLAANHPNTLMDVLLAATGLDRRVGFVAKATLFDNPVAGWIFRSMGAVPVYRRQDGGGGESNDNALRACEDTVAEGGAILIFPEGISQEQPRLQPLKTGLARIALGAEARAPGQVTVVPVALVYDDHETFRSRARVRYLTPIQVAPFAALAAGDPESFAPARALTRAIDEALREEVVHVEQSEHDPLVREVDALLGVDQDARHAAGGRLAMTPIVARAVNHFAQREPERVAAVRAELERYRAALAGAGVDDHAVRERARHPNAAATLVFALGAPLALWGVLNHFVLYQLPRLVLRVVRIHPLYNASAKLLIGLLGLFATYAVQGVAVYELCAGPLAAQVSRLGAWATPAGLTAIYLGTLPACGLIALLWLEAWESRSRRAAAARARRRLGPRLAELRGLRRAVLGSLDAAQADYLETHEPGEPEEGQGGGEPDEPDERAGPEQGGVSA